MTTIRSLSERITQAIKLENNDVPSIILPQQREMANMSRLSLDLLVRDLKSWTPIGLPNKKWTKVINVFERTILSINADINKNGRWSFWHYSAICQVTCFAYLDLIKREKHNTINLNDPKVWDSASWEEAVLTLNFISGRLYPNALSRLQEISANDDVSIEDVCKTLLWHINQLG